MGSFLLGAALIAPAGLRAEDKNHNCSDNGYYDCDRKDCHTWDDHEDRAYQTWEKAEHKTHREFSKLKAKNSQNIGSGGTNIRMTTGTGTRFAKPERRSRSVSGTNKRIIALELGRIG